MNLDRKKLLLYAVTDRSWVGRQTLTEQIEDALRGGVTLVQLREKGMREADLIREALDIRELCHAYGVPLIINDNVDVALKVGADGVHVGAEDMSVCEIRERVGNDLIIGATAKTVEQAKRAENDGADYIGVGAIFPSPTKKNAIRITQDELREICSSVSIPAVAIGGITQDNISSVAESGVSGVAVVSALFSAEDITSAARELKKKASEVVAL